MVCSRLLQAADIRQVPVVLGVVQSVADQEFVRGVEADEPHVVSQVAGDALVKQSADLERPRAPLTEQRHQPLERPPRVDDVLNQNDVSPVQTALRIVNEVHRSARDSRVPIAGSHEEVDLQRPPDGANQITEKDKASLQQTEDEKVA